MGGEVCLVTFKNLFAFIGLVDGQVGVVPAFIQSQITS